MNFVLSRFLLILTSLGVNNSGKLGPVDLAIILDGTIRYSGARPEANTYLWYNALFEKVLNNFDISWNRTRVAVICNGGTFGRYPLVHSFEKLTKKGQNSLEANKGKSESLCKANQSYPKILDVLFVAAAETLRGRDSRDNVPKVSFVSTFWVSHLIEEELNFPEHAEFLRKDGKFFMFFMNTPNENNDWAKLRKLNMREENIIYSHIVGDDDVIKKMVDVICLRNDPGIVNNKTWCEAVPTHKTIKCQRNFSTLVGGCYDTPVKCEETACNCDDMYPWTDPCSVSCGGGVQKRQSGSQCPPEKECNPEPCPTESPTSNSTSSDLYAGKKTEPAKSGLSESTTIVICAVGALLLFILIVLVVVLVKRHNKKMAQKAKQDKKITSPKAKQGELGKGQKLDGKRMSETEKGLAIEIGNDGKSKLGKSVAGPGNSMANKNAGKSIVGAKSGKSIMNKSVSPSSKGGKSITSSHATASKGSKSVSSKVTGKPTKK